MSADSRVFKSLEKLKAQEKKSESKKFFFKDISEMGFDEETTVKEEQIESKSEVASNFKKIESLMRRLEDTLDRMKAGSNYLMFYGQIQDLEKQFLEMTENIEIDKDKIPPQLFNRIMLRKTKILNKKRR